MGAATQPTQPTQPTQATQPSIDVDSATSLLAISGLIVRGRQFAVVTHPSFRQAAYIEKWRRAAKIDEMMAHFDPAKDMEVSAFVADLIVRSFEDDAIFHVLAGGLVEVKNGRPVKWTRDGADALADWIADLDRAEAEQPIQRAILGVLASFFLSRIVALAASQSSLADAAIPGAPTNASDDPSPSLHPSLHRSPVTDPTHQVAQRSPVATEEATDLPDLMDRIIASASEHWLTSESKGESKNASEKPSENESALASSAS